MEWYCQSTIKHIHTCTAHDQYLTTHAGQHSLHVLDRNDGGVSFRGIYDFDTKTTHSQRRQQTTAHTTTVGSGGVAVPQLFAATGEEVRLGCTTITKRNEPKEINGGERLNTLQMSTQNVIPQIHSEEGN